MIWKTFCLFSWLNKRDRFFFLHFIIKPTRARLKWPGGKGGKSLYFETGLRVWCHLMQKKRVTPRCRPRWQNLMRLRRARIFYLFLFFLRTEVFNFPLYYWPLGHSAFNLSTDGEERSGRKMIRIFDMLVSLFVFTCHRLFYDVFLNDTWGGGDKPSIANWIRKRRLGLLTL